MKRHKLVKFDAMELKVDRSVNYREDYDLPSMMEQIRDAGGVLEPIHAIKGSNIVLKGNRRVSAVQALLVDKNIPVALKEGIEKLEVIFYEDLTEQEITELVLDHGSQKPLSRVEVIQACWRLQRQMRSEKDIILLLYHQLARFTGNAQKAYEAAQLPEGPARIKHLHTWLHGTVGNYILAVGSMGERVREQFLLTERKSDRALTEEEKARVQFTVQRTRVNELISAKKKDEKEGAGWSPVEGGVEFNALIEKYIKEDKGEDVGDAKKKPTATQMKSAGDAMKSGLRDVYHHCAGLLSPEKVGAIDALDVELFRLEQIKKATREVVDKVEVGAQFSGGEVRELLNLLLNGNGPDFASYVKRFAQ